MSINHVDLYKQGFHTYYTYNIICDFIYDFIIIIFLITSQVVIIAWFYKNEQHVLEMSKQIETLKSTSNIRLSEMSKQIETLRSTMNTNKIISNKNEQHVSEMSKQIKTLKSTSNIRLSEMSKHIETLKSTMNTNKIISDKNEQRLLEITKQIESLETYSFFILFNDASPHHIDTKLLDEKNIENLLEFYSSLKYCNSSRLFNEFIKNWLRYATETQLIYIIPKFIKYNYTYNFTSLYDGRTEYYFNDPNFLRYFKDETRGYGNSLELHERISNAFLRIDN